MQFEIKKKKQGKNLSIHQNSTTSEKMFFFFFVRLMSMPLILISKSSAVSATKEAQKRIVATR